MKSRLIKCANAAVCRSRCSLRSGVRFTARHQLAFAGGGCSDQGPPEILQHRRGRTVEESKKSQASVIAVVPMMLLIMLTVLMVQLQSFQRLILVLSVAPLGLIGVVAALLLSGRPLSFVAILGILALLGMITKNAVILIGQIEAERAEGKDVWQAAIDASSARFRPIMLTAVATVLGMIPIATTVFWGPMAFAIMGGVAARNSSHADFPADDLRGFDSGEGRPLRFSVVGRDMRARRRHAPRASVPHLL